MKLASVEIVAEVLPHNNADSLEIVRVLGYECIVQKDKFAQGDRVVLIQPDTILPDEPWAAVFKARSNRVKACKLRGVWSFGIVMPLYDLVPFEYANQLTIGDDISEYLGVTKYETPPPKDLQAAGYLPKGLPKTDEERWQNIADLPYGEKCDITFKVDGSSMTVFARKNDDGIWETGICSRSLQLKDECSNQYTLAAAKENLVEKLLAYCQEHNVSLALRGEIYGVGIQGHGKNPHAKSPLGFAAYSVWNMDDYRYEAHDDPHHYVKLCEALNIQTVEIIERDVVLTPEHIRYYSKDITILNGKPFEGVVVKMHKGGSFKIINLSYDERK
jgi:RNA ligase (TIGR02306 family)